MRTVLVVIVEALERPREPPASQVEESSSPERKTTKASGSILFDRNKQLLLCRKAELRASSLGSLEHDP